MNKTVISGRSREVFDDPFDFAARACTKLYSLWLARTYPFAHAGQNLSIHFPCILSKALSRYISLGSDVIIRKDVWLNVVPGFADEAIIVIGNRCTIGARSSISAKNHVQIEDDVIIAVSALITDHNHAFGDVTTPIRDQGVTVGGRVQIGQGSWIGQGAAIIAGDSDLIIGRQCVIGANSVITRSIPPYSVVTGNPGRVVKRYDPVHCAWLLGNAPGVKADLGSEGTRAGVLNAEHLATSTSCGDMDT